tara:strand:+ start:80 stop:622 length:543 start_codon:yes stop_codon:yes gene_type:complete
MAKPLDYNISQTIKEYLGKQNQTKTITEISRTLDIGRNSIAKHLELLKIQGLVEERTVGQAKLWSLTATPFDSDKYGVSIRDLKAKHIYLFGAKALSKFGFDVETFKGKTTAEVLGLEYVDVDEKAMETIISGKPTISHKHYKTRKNEAKVIQYFFPNFDNNNKIIGAISFASIIEIIND